MFYYLNNFFAFSVFGFIFETLLFNIFNIHKYSGFLYLWWTPFYGSGVIIIILINNLVNKFNLSKTKKNIILFFSYFIILSLLEFVGGILLEKLFGYALWDYSFLPFNIGKHISIETSLVWTLFGFIYTYLIKKYSDKIINKIPKFITIILTLVFIIDNILTIYHLLDIRSIIKLFSFL